VQVALLDSARIRGKLFCINRSSAINVEVKLSIRCVQLFLERISTCPEAVAVMPISVPHTSTQKTQAFWTFPPPRQSPAGRLDTSKGGMMPEVVGQLSHQRQRGGHERRVTVMTWARWTENNEQIPVTYGE